MWKSPSWKDTILWGKNYNSHLANLSHSKGLQDTICSTTNTLEIERQTHINRRPTPQELSNRNIYKRRHDRNIPLTKQKLPIKFLPLTGTNKETTHIRLPKAQQLLAGGTLQDGRCTSTERNCRKGRLHVQVRPKRCFCGHSNTPRLSRLSKFQKSRNSIPLQISSLRPKCGTQSVFKDYEIYHRTSRKRRHSFLALPTFLEIVLLAFSITSSILLFEFWSST